MLNLFKKKKQQPKIIIPELIVPKLNIKIAKQIRDAKIKTLDNIYFDLFMDPEQLFKVLTKDAITALKVYKIMLQDKRTQQQFDDSFNNINGYQKISDVIFQSYFNFFLLPLLSRQRLKMIVSRYHLIRQKDELQQKIVGNSFIKQLG